MRDPPTERQGQQNRRSYAQSNLLTCRDESELGRWLSRACMRKALDGTRCGKEPTGVHVTTNESFAGEPVEADETAMQSALDSSLIAWLAHL